MSATFPMNRLVQVITSDDARIRDQALDVLCASTSLSRLAVDCAALDEFRRQSTNLYSQVRAMVFLAAIYRYYIPKHLAGGTIGRIPFAAYRHLLERRFPEAIDALVSAQLEQG